MIKNNSTTPATETTGEPVTEQAPTNTATLPVITLPDGYLDDGYYAITDKGLKYLRTQYVADYAMELSNTFSSKMKSSDFAALFRELERSKKKTLPFEARMTAVSEMYPKALSLVHRKKAPPLLADFVKANFAAIQNDDDAAAFLRHCKAIHGYMG